MATSNKKVVKQDFQPLLAKHDGWLYRLTEDARIGRFNLHRFALTSVLVNGFAEGELVTSSINQIDCLSLISLNEQGKVVVAALPLYKEGAVLSVLRAEFVPAVPKVLELPELVETVETSVEQPQEVAAY